MHFHLTPELFLQAGGCTEFTCPADRFDLHAAGIALIPRGVPHGERALDQRERRFRGLVCCFDERGRGGCKMTLIMTKRAVGSRPTVDFLDPFAVPEILQATRYMDDAAAISPNASTTAEARRRALVFAAISVIYDAVMRSSADRKQHAGNPKVAKCRELIQACLPNPTLSVESLAREVGCTPDHLSRCFREEHGLPVLAYVRQQRLSLAKDLMMDPKVNISEVAWACGFNGLNYFVRAFRKAEGRSPRRFRCSLLGSQGIEAHRPIAGESA